MSDFLRTGQFLTLLESYHVALNAWAEAEKTFETAALVQQLLEWKDRKKRALQVMLREVAQSEARKALVEVPEGWLLEILDADNPQALKGPFEVQLKKAKRGR